MPLSAPFGCNDERELIILGSKHQRPGLGVVRKRKRELTSWLTHRDLTAGCAPWQAPELERCSGLGAPAETSKSGYCVWFGSELRRSTTGRKQTLIGLCALGSAGRVARPAP